jgi:hypothetical protein
VKPPTGGVFVYRVGGFRGRALAQKIKKNRLHKETGCGILRVARQIRSSPGGVVPRFAERKLTRVVRKRTKDL